MRLHRSQVIFCAIALCAAAGSAPAAEPIGQIVQATPGAAAGTGGDRRVLATGAPITAGETLVMDASGKAVVQFADASRLSVGTNSAVAVERFTSASVPSSVVIRVTKGVLRFAAGRSDPDLYRIETPEASVGIRGARIDVGIDKGAVRVSVIEGSVVLCPQRGRPEFADCVEATAGQTVTSTAVRAKAVATASLPTRRANLLPLTGTAGTGAPSPAAQAVGGAATAVFGVAGAVNSVATKVIGATGKVGGAVLNETVGAVGRPLSGTDRDDPAITRPRDE